MKDNKKRLEIGTSFERGAAKSINYVTDYVEFEVLTAVIMKHPISWNITPCSPLKINIRFGGTRRSACHLLSHWFLVRLILRP
jgi:tartrate dehydratase alpha subunit/fumarate hydratase class I-like protein